MGNLNGLANGFTTTSQNNNHRHEDVVSSDEDDERREGGSDRRPFELVVFGSIVQDLVSYIERPPKPGESVRGHSFRTFCGGKGANQAVMASKLGTRVAMIGCVGDDIFAESNCRSIAQSGVDISMVEALQGASTGVACISVTDDGENSIVVTLGANECLGAKRAQELKSVIGGAQMVLCQQEVEDAGNFEALRLANENGVTTFFNPAPGKNELIKGILQFCDVICANENEAEFLAGIQISSAKEEEECARRILEQGPRLVIITLGPRGALVAQRHVSKGEEKEAGQVQMRRVEAPKVLAVDTTGAGDSFCGSLAHFLIAADWKPQKQASFDIVISAVRKAVQIAALTVQRYGAQASYPERAELQTLGVFKIS